MNREAVINELNGQIMKLLELYQRKEYILEESNKAEVEIKKLKVEIKNLEGVIQTLQIMLQTDGFVNMSKLQQTKQPINDTNNSLTNRENKEDDQKN